MLMRTQRFVWLIWMAAILLLLMWVFSPIEVQGHDEPVPEVTMCQNEDELGVYTFPVGQMQDLFALCTEVGGIIVVVDDPGPDEMVRIMWEFGLYNPYWVIEDLFFGDEESPAPEE